MVIVDYWVLLILEGKWPFKKGSPYSHIYSKWRGWLGLGFVPPIHLGKIMDLIRNGFKDLMWGTGTVPFWLKPGQRERKPKLSAAVTVSQRKRQPRACTPACSGRLQTLCFPVDPLLGERSAARGKVRKNEWRFLGSSGSFFAPEGPGLLYLLTAIVCGEAGRPAPLGSGGKECSVHSLPLPGIRLEEAQEDGSFWVPLDTCPLCVSWGGSVDPGKRTNVNVYCQVSRAPDLSPDCNWNLLSLILLIWGWEGAGVALGVQQCMSLIYRIYRVLC